MSNAVLQPQPLVRVPSGIAGLDTILEGGFFRGGTYLVTGAPGTGKTVLGNQVAFNHVESGGHAVYVTLLGEEHGRMLAYHQSFAFFNPQPIANTLHFFNGYRSLVDEGLNGLLEFLRETIRDHRTTLLVLDGLWAVKAAAESGMAFKNFLHNLQVYTTATACTTLLLSSPDHPQPTLERTIVDGVLHLSQKIVGLRAVRELEFPKFRGSHYLQGRHFFEITSEGVVVHPRTEALLASPATLPTTSRPRLSLGIPQLDEMLRGGILSRSTTMLLGASGSGKTLLGLHFLAAGAREDQAGLYFGFYEPPAYLISLADQVGLDFSGQTSSGMIEILWQPALERNLDSLAEQLLEAVRRRQVQRLFIDKLDGFTQVAIYPERLSRFFTALLNELRALGVTTLFSVQTPNLFGPAIQVPIVGLSPLAENVILLRYVERPSQLHRLISILKAGEHEFDPAIREFKITQRGIDVAATAESAEAILTGVARPLSSRSSAAPESNQDSSPVTE